jgi:hypothetical protein
VISLAAQTDRANNHNKEHWEGSQADKRDFPDSNVLLAQINSRLDKLETDYLSKLGKSDQRYAMQLVSEIKELVLLQDQLQANHHSDRYREHRYYLGSTVTPMRKTDFEELKASIRKNSFGDDGLNVLKLAADGNYFRCEQIVELLALFAFESDKLKALQIAYPRCSDPNNKFRIPNAFKFDTDEARRILGIEE